MVTVRDTARCDHPYPSMSFEIALGHLKNGLSMARHGWHGENMFIRMQMPDEHSMNTLPYIYIVVPASDANNYRPSEDSVHRCPWVASHSDLLMHDWYIVSPK